MKGKLNESTDSEGICADYRNPLSSGRGSMTSSPINTDRMSLSVISTSWRTPSKIPALMTKSLHSQRSLSTPQRAKTVYGSGEQMCQNDVISGFRSGGYSRVETELLLSRSQERRQQRASSYDPRCLLVIQSAPRRLSISASATTTSPLQTMMTSSMHNAGSFSRLLPKRPQWVRSQASSSVRLAESTVSQDSFEMMAGNSKFYLDSDEDSDDEDAVAETPKSRRKLASIRKMKDRNRKKLRSSIRRLHPRSSISKFADPAAAPDFSSFFCVSSPVFYLLLAFLFRVLLFFTETFFPI